MRTFFQETTEEKEARIAAVNARNRHEYMAIVATVAARENQRDSAVAEEAMHIWIDASIAFGQYIRESK